MSYHVAGTRILSHTLPPNLASIQQVDLGLYRAECLCKNWAAHGSLQEVLGFLSDHLPQHVQVVVWSKERMDAEKARQA